MTRLFTLPDLAERNGLERGAGGRLLGREYREGRLQAVKLGRRLHAEQGDFDGWIKLCREKSSRPASTSEGEDHQVGSSSMDDEKSARASARSTAKMLTNSGKPSPTTGQPGPNDRAAPELQNA